MIVDMKKVNIIFIMFFMVEIRRSQQNTSPENDDIFSRQEKLETRWKTREFHFINVIGGSAGSNGKFISLRGNLRSDLNGTTDLKLASEDRITTDVYNSTFVNKTNGDVNNLPNDVNNEKIDVNNESTVQNVMETSTTDVSVDSSDFETKENAVPTEKAPSQVSVPESNEHIVEKTDDLNQLSFIKIKSKNETQESQAGDAAKTDDRIETSAQTRLKEQMDLINKVTKFGLEQMHELFDVIEPRLYKSGIYLEDGSPGRYLAAFNSQTDEQKKLARYGYAALKASARLKEELTASKSRVEILNITEENTKHFPQISLLDTSLHEDCPLRHEPRCPNWATLYRTADGTCNNWNKPWWGSVFQPLKRFLFSSYSDGLEEVRRSVRGGSLPSPRIVSTAVHWDRDATSNSVTHMVMQWGQFIDHDLTSSSQSRGFNGSVPRCCDTQPESQHPDCLPIEVPPNDRFYSRFRIKCLEFLRSAPTSRVGCALGPREQVNQVTSYLDGSMIYGSTFREASSLRLFRNGMLKYTRLQQRLPLLPSDENRGEFCRQPNRNFDCFLSGDGRVNEQPGLIAMHIIFLRLHNRFTRELAHLNPHWSDERLYQETRRIVVAVLQHITYREFLPVVLGQNVLEIFDIQLLKTGYYNEYSSTTSGTAANAFATAAFRFGHSMVQGRFLRWNAITQQASSNVSLHEELADPSKLHRFGAVDDLVLGMCVQGAQSRDEHLTEELTNHLFETPRFPAGLDLAAINIQRGRDHGLPGYNAWRNPCGLRKMKTWEDLPNVMPQESSNNMRRVYRDVDDIDLYTGGLAEHPVRGGLVGSTFACIIAQQFRNLRRGDRFWYENGGLPSSFTSDQLEELRRVTLARILCDNLDLSDEIQPFVFLTVDNLRNSKVSCRSSSIPFLDLSAWRESFKGKWSGKINASLHAAPLSDPPYMETHSYSQTEFPTPIASAD